MRAKTKKIPATVKLVISLDRGLATKVQLDAKKRTGGNVSAWLAAAARDRLRIQAMEDALAAFEAEHGPITKAEQAEAERKWPRV